MTNRMKTAFAALALGAGLAATPALAQTYVYERPAPGYDADGSLNVFGARIDRPQTTTNGPFQPLAPVQALTTGVVAVPGTVYRGVTGY